MKRPVSLHLYAAATTLAEPFAPALLKRRLKRGKEDRFRLDERRGVASFSRPLGPLVWLHGASVGESLSHLPLVERFVRERNDLTLVVTSGTVTSAALMAKRLPKGVFHQFAPIDTPAATRRFAEHWRPDLAIFVESEIWPNLLQAVKATGAKLALMSARMSDRSMRGWSRLPGTARALFGLFDTVTTQDDRTADWLARHGVATAGRLDLKRLASPLPADPQALERLQAAAGDRRVLVAASTHAGEETRIAEIFQHLPGAPLLVIVPRHPERGEAVEVAMASMGFKAARRALGDPLTRETQVYVADTLGELGLFYRLADVVLMGGSLAEGLTGHNPLEAARLAKAIVSGPNTASFADTYAALLAEKAILVAHGPGELATALTALMGEPALATALGQRALAASAEDAADFDAAWAALQALLPPTP